MAKKRKAKKRTTAKRKSTAKRKGGGLTSMKWNLSPELAAVCGCKSCTRPQVMKKIWHYIKSRKCQDTKNRRMINPDHKLAEVLGKRPVNMLKMAGMLNKHIKRA